MHRIASLACCLILPLSLATAACTSGSGTPAGTTDTVGGSDTTVAQGDTAGAHTSMVHAAEAGGQQPGYALLLQAAN